MTMPISAMAVTNESMEPPSYRLVAGTQEATRKLVFIRRRRDFAEGIRLG